MAKNPAAVTLGRAGGKARAGNLSAAERSESFRCKGWTEMSPLTRNRRVRAQIYIDEASYQALREYAKRHKDKLPDVMAYALGLGIQDVIDSEEPSLDRERPSTW